MYAGLGKNEIKPAVCKAWEIISSRPVVFL